MTTSSANGPATLTEILVHRARVAAEEAGFVFLGEDGRESQRWTYGSLQERAIAIASILAREGRGERALLLFRPGLDFLAAFFGCLYAQVLPVPANTPKRRRGASRLQAIIEDSQPRFLLSTSSALQEIVGVDGSGLGKLIPIAVDEIKVTDGLDVPAPPSPSDIAFLQYTSGSTSTPKGVTVSHRNVMATLKDLDRGWGHGPGSAIVTWLPAFHDMGLVYGALLPVYAGIPCYAMAPSTFLQRPVRWLEAISRYRATHSAAPNFAYDLCSDRISEETAKTLNLRTWKVAVNGAETVRASTLDRFASKFEVAGFDIKTFCPGYGLAESTLKVSAVRAGEPVRFLHVGSEGLKLGRIMPVAPGTHGSQILVGCGRSEIDGRIAIVDPETQQRCGPDSIGEIWVSSDAIADGYWNRPQESCDVFQARIAGTSEESFLRTGDLGALYDGELFITGRLKDLIVIAGQNYHPQDIEARAEAAHPQLRGGRCASFAIDGAGTERVVVVQEVARTEVRRLRDTEIIGAIRSAVREALELELEMVVLLPPGTIPRTSSGKLQRSLCRKLLLDGGLEILSQSSATPSHAERSRSVLADAQSIEEWTIRWLTRRLGLDASAIEPDGAFADLGLNSLGMVELATDLRDALDNETPMSDTILWECATPRALAERIGGQIARTANPQLAPALVEQLGLDRMSESELCDLLAEELSRLEEHR